ncbi:MAG: hypothetical protein ACRD12_09900 [Acidimicrobiales bacterium]
MAELSGLGLSVDLPDGWDGRIYTRDEAGGTRASLHGATFPLPGMRGDYGSGAVEMMGPEDVLVVLLEFDPSSTGQPLFAAQGFPTLYPTNFTQRNLQRPIAGQAGAQWFFTEAGRAFCLYVVLGLLTDRDRLAPLAADVVARIRVV